MLSGLADAVEALDVPLDGDAIADAIRLRDVLDAKIAVAVGDYDAQGLYAFDGAVSMSGWIKQRAGLTGGAAAVLVRVARRVRQLPCLRAAWLDGGLSGGQVQAIVANLTDHTIEQFQEHEADLVPVLRPLSTADTAHVMRLWRARAEATLDHADPRERRRTAHLSELLDGRGRLDADLDADAFALARNALRVAESPDCDCDEPRTPAERRGDALADIFGFYLDHHDDTPKSRNRPHVNIVIDWDEIFAGGGGEYADGGYASPATIRQALCDSDIHRVVKQGRSVILDFGTSARLFSDAQFNALVLRDRGCRVYGCDRPPSCCQAHHVVPFDNGGHTALWNGVLKCPRHHHLGHKPGWTEKLEPDGTYHLTAPDGRTWTTYPRGVTPPLI